MLENSRIAIIIVNYRTPQLVAECLDSLRGERVPGLDFRVFVGDADSGDGSTGIIQNHIDREGLGDWVSCFDIGKNGGFAYGNNAIFRRCVAPDPGFDLVYFLNPDTYVRPGAIAALVGFLRAHPKAGVVGSRLENPDGSRRAYAFRFPSPWREFFRGARSGVLDRLVPSAAVSIPGVEATREVDWVTGASFMMPRRVLDDVGLMDDGYFLYFEETDLMARVRKAGYTVWHVAESRVVHLAGQSTGVRTGDPEIRRLSPVWLQSRERYLRKHYGRVGVVLGNLFFLGGDLVYRLQCLLRRKPVHNPPHLWGDYLNHGRPGRS